MDEWIEYAKLAGGFVGAAGIATMAKLYHDRVVAGKDTELRLKDAEIVRIQAELAKVQSQVRDADGDATTDQRDLARLRSQLMELVERLAKALGAQAASLYVPIFSTHDDRFEFPRGFAFVAAYNVDPAATEAILRMKLVETWTVVGECWTKGAVLSDNALQDNVRHVASYDQQSGFVPIHTLVSPVRWGDRQVGVIQVFNKTAPGGLHDLDPRGFDSEDRKALVEWVQDTGASGIADKTHHFQSSRDCARFLGLQGELDLENAAILYVDLTRSSSLFDEMPLLDAARLLNCFNEYVYRCMERFSAVVEKFSGDGTLVRFHYGGFNADQPASNPAFRAVCAAADMAKDFKDFKARHWKELADEVASDVRLRISISLGPVISTNVGPRQFQVPTVMGQCVNRAAKMVAYAPRDRDTVLVDDNVRKALLQIDRQHAGAMHEFTAWSDSAAASAPSLARHQYFELMHGPFRAAAAEFR